MRLAWAAAGLLVVSTVQAQGTQRCDITGNTQTNRKLPSGQYNSYMGGGVTARCPAKGLSLRADSLESYGDEQRIFFLGHVRYEEPRLTLNSDFLTYFQAEERILAQGDVDARLPNGSTMKGPWAEYLRPMPGTRPLTRLRATGRPVFTIVKRDTATTPPPPTKVVANLVTMVGDSLVYASGGAEVTREDIEARGDSIALDSGKEIVILMRGPSITGKRSRPFAMSGERIELTSKERKLERVLSMGRAKALSEDLVLESDTIQLRAANDLLQRAIAWGPSRARASSSSQHIMADSIDVDMPGQNVREMHAVRGAVAEGKPDTTRYKADTLDWMRGDTIVARFDSILPTDTNKTARLRTLLARGHARSYNHLAPSDTAMRRPAINYVTGREIIVDIRNQRVAKVTVVDKATGIYIEPKAIAARPDTARAGATPPVRPPATRPPSRPVPATPRPR